MVMTKQPKPPQSKPKQYKNKELPKPRRRYYVAEPVVVIPLAQLEQLANHLTDISMMDRRTIHQNDVTMDRHKLFLRQIRDDVRNAKKYYGIWSGNDEKGTNPKPELPTDR